MSIFDEGFRSLMLPLPLTLNAEPWTCERLQIYPVWFRLVRVRWCVIVV